MPHTPIVPDGHIIPLPLEAYLSVMVLRDQVEEIVEQYVELVFSHPIDALYEPFVHIN